jgi:hypothetical protein
MFPVFLALNHKFRPADRLHIVAACGGHFRGLTARFFFSPGFLRFVFLAEKVAKPL